MEITKEQVLGHTAQDNRTLGIQRRTKSTNSGPEVRTGRGFEGTCTGKERAGLGKAPMRCDDSTWEGREAGLIQPHRWLHSVWKWQGQASEYP